MSEANKQTAIRFLEALSVGDEEAASQCLTDDAFTITKGFGGVSGTRDRATILATIKAFRDLVPSGFKPRVETIVAEGDTVVVEWEGDAVLSNGVDYCNQYVFVLSFEQGRIRQLNEYFCTALADRTILPLLSELGDGLTHGK